MAQDLSDLTARVLDAAKRAGADDADILAYRNTSLSVEVLGGKLEHAERSESLDLGLRVMVGKRQANVASSLFDDATITTLAERAVSMAREAPEDPHIGLADANQLAQKYDAGDLDLFDPGKPPSPEALEDQARRAEASALAVKGISKIDSAAAHYGEQQFHLATSNGFSGGYKRNGQSLSCVAITGDATDMERDYYGENRVYGADLSAAEDVGRIAGKRTVARAGARKPKTGAYPVVFDERISGSLIGHLLMASNGRSVSLGQSWLRDKLGEQVLPSALSIIEEPHRKRIANSRPFDGEGLPTATRDIVKDGVLMGWTLNLYYARKLGMESTGNASRGTGGPPSSAISNISVTQSAQSREDLLKDMGTGLLVTSMIGSTINPNTGDYSRGASGFWVKNGEITYPVNECTIAGNLLDMLMTLRPANDAQDHLSRRVPSLLVEGMTLAGD